MLTLLNPTKQVVTTTTTINSQDFEIVGVSPGYTTGSVGVTVSILCTASGTSAGYYESFALFSISSSVVSLVSNTSRVTAGTAFTVSVSGIGSTVVRVSITPPYATSMKWAVWLCGLVIDTNAS